MTEERSDEIKEKKLTHITGAFVVDGMPSFLNGAGIAKWQEDKNLTIPKSFADGIGSVESDSDTEEIEGGPRRIRNYRTTYVSSQALRYMIKDTVTELYNYKPNPMRALKQSDEGHTSKAGTGLDPVANPTDDSNGYMYTSEGSGKPVVKAVTTTEGSTELVVTETETKTEGAEEVAEDTTNDGSKSTPTTSTRVKTVARTSPLSTSILVGMRKTACEGIDEAFVHLKEGTPLPYSTKFANTPFEAIFSLDYSRLCKFVNMGDRIELAEPLVEKYLADKTIVELQDKPEYYSLQTEVKDVVETKGKNKGKLKKDKVSTPVKQFGNVYEMANAIQVRKDRTSALLNSIAHLNGGAKQAAFHTDVAPKVLIMAGLSSGNPIFNRLFSDDNSGPNRGQTVSINVKALKEIASDYKDMLVTPIYVGIRTGFLKPENEEQIKNELTRELGFIVTTPITAAQQLSNELPTVGK